jgi:hypothetical protein
VARGEARFLFLKLKAARNRAETLERRYVMSLAQIEGM